MAIGGPPVEIDNFQSASLACGTFRCRKKFSKTWMQFSWKFCFTYSGKAIPQSKDPNSTSIEDIDIRLISNDAAVLDHTGGIPLSLSTGILTIKIVRSILWTREVKSLFQELIHGEFFVFFP